MIRKWRQAELSFLYVTLHTDLFYNLTKFYPNLSNGCRVMLQKPIVDARPNARPPAGLHHFNN